MTKSINYVKADLNFGGTKIAGLGAEFLHDTRDSGSLEDLGRLFNDAEKAIREQFPGLVTKNKQVFIRGISEEGILDSNK